MMKKNTYINKLLMVFAVTGLLMACESDNLQIKQPQVYENGLSVIPSIYQGSINKAVTRAETVDAEATLNENILNSLDVFVTRAGQDAIINQWHLTNPNDGLESTVQSLLDSDWKRNTNIEIGSSYDVYVAANNDLTKTNRTTVTALKQLVVNDVNIQKKYAADASNIESKPFLSDKSFVMDGKITGWTPDANTKEQVFKVNMKRAAAKIQMNMNFSENFLNMLKYRYDEKKYATDGTLVWIDEDGNVVDEDHKVEKAQADQIKVSGTPAWRHVNFVSNAPVFTEGTFADGETYHTTFRQTMYFGSLKSIAGEDKSFEIVTYSYPYQWTEETAINDAPFIMISIEFDSWNVEKNDWEPSYYYYRIPVCDEKTVTSLDRNNIYIVNATIDSFGSAGEDIDQNVTLEYEVIEWTEDAADNSNVLGKPLDFLMVSPLTTNIYGDSGEATINVYAPNGKKALVKQLLNNGSEDVWALWKDASATTRYDKTVQTVPAEATDSKIVVSSTAMVNHAVKTITFRVYLEGHEELYHDVIIKHFPTESIQNFQGAWSSKTTSRWVNWDEDNGKNVTRTCSDNNFSAKVYLYFNRTNNYEAGYYCVKIYKPNGQNSTITYMNPQDGNTKNLTNNRMYVVQISSTSDSYILGKPILGNPSASQSRDNVVSPAFMIASQLGAVQSFTGNNAARNAATHCTEYKEVGTDGTVYTGWRLPTAAEIAVIADRQNDDDYKDVITEVLGGERYYNLSGSYTSIPGKTGTSIYVRCVRDLTDDDLKRINGE